MDKPRQGAKGTVLKLTEWHQTALQLSPPDGVPKDRRLVRLSDGVRRRWSGVLVVIPVTHVTRGVSAAWKFAVNGNWTDSLRRGTPKKCRMKGSTHKLARSQCRAVLGEVGEGNLRFHVSGDAMFCTRDLTEEELKHLAPDFLKNATPIDDEHEWQETHDGKEVTDD